MIRYPNEVKAEMVALSKEFCEQADDSINALDDRAIAEAMQNYVYTHCSARTRSFLDDVDAIMAYASKHNIMAG